jgi:hypothetical protein
MSPRFVEYGPLMTPPAPFRSVGTRLWGFFAQADAERLAALTERVFAQTSGGAVQVRPLGHHVMLTWGRITSVGSLQPDWADRGGVAEPQVVVWVPCVRESKLAVFVPFIWVDNAMSLATGRELFGYPKAWGWIGFPDEAAPGAEGATAGATAGAWTLDAFGLDYAAGALAARHPLLRIERSGSAGGSSAEPHHSALEVVRHAARSLWGTLRPDHLLDDAERIPALVEDLVRHEFPQLFLKQMRSVEDGEEACLQQITECWYRVRTMHGTPRLGEYALTVHPLDSQPLTTELGLLSQPLRVAYELEIEFDVGGGSVLWDAAAPPADAPR